MITFGADLTVVKAPVDLAGTLVPALAFSGDLTIGAGVSQGPRPYGVGPYGVGPYSRWPAPPGIYDVAAASGIVFAANASARALHVLQARSGIVFAAAAKPTAVMPLRAASGILFSARLRGLQRILQPEAISEIVFTPVADVRVTWSSWAPCEPGGWQSPPPCEDGAWQPPGACSGGTWTKTRLP